MTTLINLTPHALNIMDAQGNSFEIPVNSDLPPVRVEQQNTIAQEIDYMGKKVLIYQTMYGEIQNLPRPHADVVYIVSRLVKDRCPERLDVLTPGVGVRDPEGRIIGCRGLSR